MKNMKHTLIAVMISSIVLSSCGSNSAQQSNQIQSNSTQNSEVAKTSDASSLKVVTINFQDINFLVDFAKAKQFFEQNGVHPDFLNIGNGTDKLLLANQVDVKIGGVSNPL